MRRDVQQAAGNGGSEGRDSGCEARVCSGYEHRLPAKTNLGAYASCVTLASCLASLNPSFLWEVGMMLALSSCEDSVAE